MSTPLVATFLDLPADSPGGSVELFRDLYTGPEPLIPARAFMLPPRTHRPGSTLGLELLPVGGKCLDGPAFGLYVNALRRALSAELEPASITVLHLQHLAFGATPALIRALPAHPKIALVHGTDLLFAELHRDQLRVLRETARTVDAIVIPTGAMADRLYDLAPQIDRRKVVHIPWGIPDHLLGPLPDRSPRRPDHSLRLLYAGRLTPEKGGDQLAKAMSAVQGIELSIAAPATEFHALMPQFRRLGVHTRYLGWLPRRRLWTTFADYDALVMPSTTLEAMGLVALEAQARGLPVIYQPVPGLRDALGTSALATDFGNPAEVAREINRLKSSPNFLSALRQAGRTNASRFPLSRTAEQLTALSVQLS